MSDKGDAGAQPMACGLRARARDRKTRVEGNVELGSAQANAYFHATKLGHRKRVPRKQKPPPLAERLALKHAASFSSATPAPAKQGKGGPKQGQGAGEEKGGNASRGVERKRKIPEAPKEEPDEEGGKLVLPPHGDMRAALKEANALEEHQLEARREQLAKLFPNWKSELLAGFNLLFYGVGSKLALLQDFAASYLSDSLVVQLHGYLPTASLRYLISFIQDEVLQLRVKTNRTLLQQCRDIAKTKAPPPLGRVHHVCILVHSIDGLALRTPEAQTCMSWLAKAPFVSLIASIDHINGPSMWKEEDSLRFEWLSQSLHTCAPYTDEVELRLAKRTKTADPSSSGVKFILQSLTPTDVSTLQELARQQLATAATARTERLRGKAAKLPTYQSVYEACRKKLLHTSLLSMKNSTKCLEDHGLLKRIRMQAAEYLEVPLPEPIIRTEVLQLDPQN